eukprot:scaffold127649_cov31-Prasinocladus_malaysianus.AAC.1
MFVALIMNYGLRLRTSQAHTISNRIIVIVLVIWRLQPAMSLTLALISSPLGSYWFAASNNTSTMLGFEQLASLWPDDGRT